MERERVDHPSHYNQGGVECIEAMESAYGRASVSAFCVMNAFKYLWRYNDKDNAVEDLKKAKWYINKAIDYEHQG